MIYIVIAAVVAAVAYGVWKVRSKKSTSAVRGGGSGAGNAQQ
jgi:hypothetical protein